MNSARMVLLASLGVAVCGVSAHAQAIDAVDGRGHRVHLKAPPKRIVSIAPNTTEILFALGLKGRIVADTTYCDYPPEARALPKVGDMNTSVEKVLAQRPDLVVATTSANPRAIRALESLSTGRVSLFCVDAKDFPHLYEAIREIGAVTATTAAANVLVGSMQRRVAAVAARVRRLPTAVRTLVVLQADPLWVAGGSNFLDNMLTLAGGMNVGRTTGEGYHTTTIETAIALRPDVVLVGQDSVKRLRANPAWRVTPAFRSRRVYSIDPGILVRPGPRLVDALETLFALLHEHAIGSRTAPSRP